MTYRPDLDGLRCIAVLLVLVFHFELFPIGAGGFIGVDVFFVLSGFLISSIIWKQLGEGTFRLPSFYVRRLRRLAPAAVVVQLLVLGFAYFRLLPNRALPVSWQSVANQAYVINFYLWQNIDYFGLRADAVPLLHCWSLAIEEQFYLFFPLLLVLVHRFFPSRRWLVLCTLTLASFVLNLLFVKDRPEATFYLLPTRAWELFLGAIAGAFVPYFQVRRWLRHGAAALGMGLLAVGLYAYDGGISFPGTFALLPCLGAVALILAGTGEGSWLSPVVSSKPAVYLGRISYSLYLVHWPLRVFGAAQAEPYDDVWRWSLFVVSIAAASALYALVEDPIRRGTLLPRQKPFVWAYALSAAGIIALGLTGVVSQGWSFRFSPEVRDLVAYTEDQDHGRRACEATHNLKVDLPECRLGDPQAEVGWLILGDSHAWALSEAMSRALDEQNLAGILAFGHACLPVQGMGRKECRQLNQHARDYLAEHDEVENVLLISIWRELHGEGMEGPDGRFLKGEAQWVAFRAQLKSTLADLQSLGKKVHVWAPLPAAPRNVPEAMALEKAFGTRAELEVPLREHLRVFASVDEALQKNLALMDSLISPVGALCPEGSCSFEREGRPLFSDNNHPARSASDFFADIFLSEIWGRRTASVDGPAAAGVAGAVVVP